MSIDAAPLAKPKGRPKRTQSSKRTIDGKALIPEVVAAAIGAKSFTKATRELTPDEAASLSRTLRMPIEEFRAELGQQLRETTAELLAITRRDLELIKPDSRAYTLAVLIDKAQALEGRNQVNNASVNIQVNNYGSATKDSLLASLQGRTQTAPSFIPNHQKSLSEPIEQLPDRIPAILPADLPTDYPVELIPSGVTNIRLA